MTTLELLDSTAKYFARYEVPSPRLTIELMLAEVQQKSRMQLYLDYEKPVPEDVMDRLRPLVKRRAEGEPLEYLLGVTTFAGQKFRVTPAVLIPRPETEILLQEAVSLIQAESLLPVLDVGTGSGILACSLARKFPNVPVFAVDNSAAALAIARENGRDQDRDLPNLAFFFSDLLTAPELPAQFQIIVANLPYIPSGQIPTLMREVQHEPKSALDGGPDGLELMARLIAQSRGRTHYLALEFGDGQAEALKNLCQKAGYTVLRVLPDFTERDRILIAQFQS